MLLPVLRDLVPVRITGSVLLAYGMHYKARSRSWFRSVSDSQIKVRTARGDCTWVCDWHRGSSVYLWTEAWRTVRQLITSNLSRLRNCRSYTSISLHLYSAFVRATNWKECRKREGAVGNSDFENDKPGVSAREGQQRRP